MPVCAEDTVPRRTAACHLGKRWLLHQMLLSALPRLHASNTAPDGMLHEHCAKQSFISLYSCSSCMVSQFHGVGDALTVALSSGKSKAPYPPAPCNCGEWVPMSLADPDRDRDRLRPIETD